MSEKHLPKADSQREGRENQEGFSRKNPSKLFSFFSL